MKKALSIFICQLLLYSCAGTYNQASHVSNSAYIGMSIQEFKEKAGRKAKLESIGNGWTIYRMNDYDAWTGARTDTKFFYFNSWGKLQQIDGGEPTGTKQTIDLNIKNK